MKLAFGIFLIIIGLWFLGETIRGRKPRFMLWGVSRLHIGGFVTGSLLTTLFMGTGTCLILGVVWWWIFLVSGIAVTYTWLAFYSRWIEKSCLKGKDISKWRW